MLAGVLIGLAFGLSRSASLRYRRLPKGGPVLIAWPTGVARAMVVARRHKTLLLSAPIMRQGYREPEPGASIRLKPLVGGTALPAKFEGSDVTGWTVRVFA